MSRKRSNTEGELFYTPPPSPKAAKIEESPAKPTKKPWKHPKRKKYKEKYYYVYREKPASRKKKPASRKAGRKTRKVKAKRKSMARKRYGLSSKDRKDLYKYRQDARDFRNYAQWSHPRGSLESKAFWGPDYKSSDQLQKYRRKVSRFKGQGDYRSIGRYAVRGLGALAGGAMGYSSGGYGGLTSGLRSGWNAGARASRWMGLGSYNNDVSTNSLMVDNPGSDMNPQQQISVNSNSAEGDVYIDYTEFIQNVTVTAAAAGTSSFTNQVFSINPGLSTVFPWLSQIATNFSLYEFEGLMFQYKPTSGEFGSTNSNSLGKVIMATNYDPDAEPFEGSQAMENYDYAQASKPSCGMVHAVETAATQRYSNLLYVRTANVTKDPVFTDLGKFQVATEGIYTGAAGTYVIGELWVTYRIKLSRKLLGHTTQGGAINCDGFYINGPGVPAMLQNYPFSGDLAVGGICRPDPQNSIGGRLRNITSQVFQYEFPRNISAGYYLILIVAENLTGLAGSSDFNLQVPTNCEVVSAFNRIQTGAYPRVNVSTNSNMLLVKMCKITAPGTLQAMIPFTVEGMSTVAGSASSYAKFQVTQISKEYWESISQFPPNLA